MSLWHRHPHVRSGKDLTLGERAADRMRNGMGSWQFVFSAVGFLGVWMGYNGHRGFDPYPFILLNLLLSCVAALQGAILLIAARRQDQVSSELAVLDYDVNKACLQFQVCTAEVLLQMCDSLGVELPENVIAALRHPGSISIPIQIKPPLGME